MSDEKKADALEAYMAGLKARRGELSEAERSAFQTLGGIQGRLAECDKILGELQRVRQDVEMEKAVLVSTPVVPPPEPDNPGAPAQ